MNLFAHAGWGGWVSGPSASLCVRWCLTLIHFVWQGAAVAALVAIVLPLLRRARPRTRYRVLLAALLTMAACPVVTFLLLQNDARVPQQAVAGPRPFGASSPLPNIYSYGYEYGASHGYGTRPPAAASPAVEAHKGNPGGATGNGDSAATRPPATGFATANLVCREHIRPYAPGATLAYLAGVALMLLRLGLALRGAQAIRRSSRPVEDDDLLSALSRQAKRLGLRRPPPLAYCARAVGPCVVGILRPTVLLPLSFASVAAGLAPGQVEAILAHELAHVRRYDHVVHFLQRLIEAVLFFHPAVWFVSNRLRAEREHCCDELAVAGAAAGTGTTSVEDGGVRLAYAEALLRAAELSGLSGRSADRYPAAALAATARPSGLRRRVARLLDGSAAEELRLGRGGAAMVLVALTAGVVAACLPDHAALPAAPGPANRAADGTTRPANAAKGLPPVLLVTENNYFLERALNALEGEPAGGPPRLTPAEYEKQCQGGGPKVWEKYAVILFDGYAPHEEPRCHGVMYVNVIGPGLSLKQARDPAREPAGGADNAPRRFLHEVKLKQPAGSHPLARTLAQERAKLDNVFAPSAMALELGPDWQTVLDGSDGPMLVAWHRPNAPPPAKAPATQPAPAPQARLVLAFSLMESNWPLKASFPLFLDESIRWLADGSAD